MMVKKDNILVKAINLVKSFFFKNKKKDIKEEKVSITVKKVDGSFLKELRNYSEEQDLIAQINADTSVLYDMSMEELEKIYETLKKRNAYLDAQIREVQHQLQQIRKTNID